MSIQSRAVRRDVEIADPMRSVELAGGKMSLVFRHGDIEVLVVELGANGCLAHPSLWGEASLHYALEGRALVEAGDRAFEVLPSHWVGLATAQPYRISNLGGERLRLLTVVCGAGATGDLGAAEEAV